MSLMQHIGAMFVHQCDEGREVEAVSTTSANACASSSVLKQNTRRAISNRRTAISFHASVLALSLDSSADSGSPVGSTSARAKPVLSVVRSGRSWGATRLPSIHHLGRSHEALGVECSKEREATSNEGEKLDVGCQGGLRRIELGKSQSMFHRVFFEAFDHTSKAIDLRLLLGNVPFDIADRKRHNLPH
jgi:hypothetical protein